MNNPQKILVILHPMATFLSVKHRSSEYDDTICAITTPVGTGAIAVIRLSGKKSFDIASNVFSLKNIREQKSHTIHHGYIMDGKSAVDEVLAFVFKNPHSYSGEDSVEFSCHGSVFIQQRVLQLLISKGARLAKPGEFTLRAFLNGRMDLSQAEAVADLIASGSEATHKVAMHQMRGGFSKEIKILRDELIHFASLIELELDFSEEDVEFANRSDLRKLIVKLQKNIQRLVDSFSVGNVIKNGIPVVITGKPNVGKSTLLNALLNEEKAIVSEIPGTTRDVIEDEITLGGITFRFFDTAGIRETTNTIEMMGVRKTLEKIKSSAVVLYLFDVHEMSSRELKDTLGSLRDEIGNSDAKILLIGNKIDKEDLSYIKKEFEGVGNILYISAREKTNIERLTLELLNLVNVGSISTRDTIVTNMRHYEALVKANNELSSVGKGMDEKLTGELLASHIRAALHHLGEITGQITTDDLLSNIFSRFCIGK